MVGRRHLETKDIKASERYKEKFNILVRYLIVAAENKRLVSYGELTKIIGISLQDTRDFAGFVGDFCNKQKIPYLNALIVNTEDGMPGDDWFTWYNSISSKPNNSFYNWGEELAKCIKYFHLKQSQVLRFKNTTEIDKKIRAFLS